MTEIRDRDQRKITLSRSEACYTGNESPERYYFSLVWVPFSFLLWSNSCTHILRFFFSFAQHKGAASRLFPHPFIWYRRGIYFLIMYYFPGVLFIQLCVCQTELTGLCASAAGWRFFLVNNEIWRRFLTTTFDNDFWQRFFSLITVSDLGLSVNDALQRGFWKYLCITP